MLQAINQLCLEWARMHETFFVSNKYILGNFTKARMKHNSSCPQILLTTCQQGIGYASSARQLILISPLLLHSFFYPTTLLFTLLLYSYIFNANTFILLFQQNCILWLPMKGDQKLSLESTHNTSYSLNLPLVDTTTINPSTFCSCSRCDTN